MGLPVRRRAIPLRDVEGHNGLYPVWFHIVTFNRRIRLIYSAMLQICRDAETKRVSVRWVANRWLPVFEQLYDSLTKNGFYACAIIQIPLMYWWNEAFTEFTEELGSVALRINDCPQAVNGPSLSSEGCLAFLLLYTPCHINDNVRNMRTHWWRECPDA